VGLRDFAISSSSLTIAAAKYRERVKVASGYSVDAVQLSCSGAENGTTSRGDNRPKDPAVLWSSGPALQADDTILQGTLKGG